MTGLLAFALLWQRGAAPVDIFQLGFLGIELVTPATYELNFDLDPVGMALRISALIGAGWLVYWLTGWWRQLRKDCGRCGRGPGPLVDRSSLVQQIAWLSVVPASAYASLKLHWIAGGSFAIDDVSVHSDLSFWSPGYGDTVLLVGFGIAVTFLMAYRIRYVPRWVLLVPAGFGSMLLLLAGASGTLMCLADLVVPFISDSEFEWWMGLLVYPTFLTWGLCFTVVTVHYYRLTRPTCRQCGPASPGGTADSSRAQLDANQVT